MMLETKTRSKDSAASMLAKVRPVLGRCGVSRVANITGLDRIGIPVAIAVRPDSCSLAVDSGKGTTVEQAMCSAAMEAMERHWSEVLDVPVVSRAVSGDEDEQEVRFPLIRGGRVPKTGTVLEWVEVKDFLTDDEILVPHRLVQTDYSNNRHGLEGRMFYSTTSGLSAGGTWEEAFVQGLYEVIERDACHMTLEKMKVTNDFAGIDMESLPAVVQALTEQVEAAGCRIVMMDCASEVDVRVYAAWIVDMEEPEIGVFRGYGAHLNGEIAATRAICEAVQARTVLMAGARDDYNHAKYLQNCRTGAAGTRALAEVKGSVEFQRGYENECDELREVVARCVEGGFDKILYYNFEVPEWCDVSVVRVMVPGMEGYWTPHVARLNEGRFRI